MECYQLEQAIIPSDIVIEILVNYNKSNGFTCKVSDDVELQYSDHPDDTPFIFLILSCVNRSTPKIIRKYDIVVFQPIAPETKGGNGFGVKPDSNQDFLVNGVAFDCYSPETANVRNIWSTVEWMYHHMCGINPVEEAPGFRKFTVKLEIYGKLYYANATLRSSMGLIESGWRREKDGSLIVQVTVPFDSDAELYLPDAETGKVDGLEGLTAEQVGEKVKVSLEAGSYIFRYTPTKEYELKYTIESPLQELLTKPETKVILAEMTPKLLAVAAGEGLGMELPYSIADITRGQDGFRLNMLLGGQVDLVKLDERLKEVPVKVRTV